MEFVDGFCAPAMVLFRSRFAENSSGHVHLITEIVPTRVLKDLYTKVYSPDTHILEADKDLD